MESKPLYQSHALQKLTWPLLRPGGLELTRESARKCDLKPGERVLDVGCGSGASARMVAEEFSLLSFGLDLDFDMVIKSNLNIPSLQAAAQKMPFRSRSFKAIFCECVLSLTPDMTSTLDEFKRVLEPGGVLILCDLYLRNRKDQDKLKKIPMACGFRKAVGKNEIQELVKGSGFADISWEDLSPALTHLACQAVFEHGSLEKFWAEVFGENCSSSRKTCETIKASRPGYFRIIARKQ